MGDLRHDKKSFVFALTPGRTGTAYLSVLFQHNLKDAEVHHEILGYDKFGIDTPNLSHFTVFNSKGNVPEIKEFWRRKFEKIAGSGSKNYVETSHLLMKAGLIENIETLRDHGSIYLIVLKRDVLKTIVSYRNRFDFFNKGNMWLWYLDPEYPRNILDSKPFLAFGINGICLWYIYEIFTRIEYYKQILKAVPEIQFIDVDLEDLKNIDALYAFFNRLGIFSMEKDQIIIPPPQNVGKSKVYISDEEMSMLDRMIQSVSFDPKSLAERYIRSHRGLL